MPTFQPSALPAGAYRVNNKNHDYWIVDKEGNIIGQTGANGQDTFFAVATINPLTGGIQLLQDNTVVVDTTVYTWAAGTKTKPPAAGNANRTILVSDIGVGGCHLISDGTYWRPLGGSVVIAEQSGSIATPISAFTGVTNSLFTPTSQPVIPNNFLIPGQSSIEVEASFRRTGSTASATLNIHFGTAKTSADNTVYAATYAATTLLDLFANPTIFVAEAGRVTSTNWQSKGGAGNTNVTLDRIGNINTAAEMGITFSITSANVADSFALIGYKVRVNQ